MKIHKFGENVLTLHAGKSMSVVTMSAWNKYLDGSQRYLAIGDGFHILAWTDFECDLINIAEQIIDKAKIEQIYDD